jgi:hypothetical protein
MKIRIIKKDAKSLINSQTISEPKTKKINCDQLRNAWVSECRENRKRQLENDRAVFFGREVTA